MINKPLGKSGTIPLREMKSGGIGSSNGQLNFRDWDMSLNEKLLSKDHLSPEELADVGNTTYHEARHGEQWYAMVRKEIADANAGKGLRERLLPSKAERAQQVKDVAGKLGVPKQVVEHAHTPWKRLTYSGKQKKFAEAMHESVYGQGAAHRNATIYNLKPHGEAVRQAKSVRDGLLIDPKATLADKAAAETALWQARQTYEATYKSYRALAEEGDAWRQGDAVGERIKEGQPATATASAVGGGGASGATGAPPSPRPARKAPHSQERAAWPPPLWLATAWPTLKPA